MVETDEILGEKLDVSAAASMDIQPFATELQPKDRVGFKKHKTKQQNNRN